MGNVACLLYITGVTLEVCTDLTYNTLCAALYSKFQDFTGVHDSDFHWGTLQLLHGVQESPT